MISIIVPNYNKSNFIKQTIHSVINQSFNAWELIIVDDQSTDNSWEVINNFVDNTKIFAFKPEKKLYGSGCRNYGLKKSKGEYVIFLDSDDLLTDNCLNDRFNFFKNFKSLDFLVFPAGTFYKKVGDSSSIWRAKKSNHLNLFLEHKLQWHTSSVIWKKSTLIELNGFDESYMRLQDVELHTRALLLKDIKYKTFNNYKPDFYYRIDNKRSNLSLEHRLFNQKQGTISYLKKISPLLSSKKQKKALKGTLFSFLNNLNYNILVLENDLDFHDKIFSSLKKEMVNFDLFDNNDFILLGFYNKLYKIGLWKIKGFNYVMKLLFIVQ